MINPVYIDGYRVYSDTTYNEQYSQDDEANPTFTELRNKVLAALAVDKKNSVYANQIALRPICAAVIPSANLNTTA